MNIRIYRGLDAGARDTVVLRVNTPQEVESIVNRAGYPLHEIRGFASNTAQTDGRAVEADEFVKAAHRSTLVVIQIERREAVAHLPEMLSATVCGIN